MPPTGISHASKEDINDTSPTIGVKIADFTRNEQVNSRVQIAFKLTDANGNGEMLILGQINAYDLYNWLDQNKLLHRPPALGVVRPTTTATRHKGKKIGKLATMSPRAEATG